MTRTVIGLDYTGTACVKITRGSFDPRTTPDGEREKFYFSSKWQNQLPTPEMFQTSLVLPPSGDNFTFFPAGSVEANYDVLRYSVRSVGATGYSAHYCRAVQFPALRYAYPLVDARARNLATGRFRSKTQVRAQRGFAGPFGSYGGYVGMEPEGAWYDGFSRVGVTTMGRGTIGEAYNDNRGNIAETLVVWNLPGDPTPLDGPPPGDPAGKMCAQITSTQCRVAKPGFDVRTATPPQLAFDATGRPLNVIAASDIAIAAGGTTVYETGVALPANTVAEVTYYTGATIYYPGIPRDDALGPEYYFVGSQIHFVNSGPACRARFIVFGSDDQLPSSGVNRVWRTFTDNGEQHIQFLRPGAADPPRFADIIIDSRRPVIQILADGYLPVPAGYAEQTISFNAAGFFPYLKYATWHGAGSLPGTGNWSAAVKAPRVKRLLPGSVQPQWAGDASWCTYTSTGATFFTARGSPVDRYYNASGTMVTDPDSNPILGIRWYVLGIPTP